MIIDHIDNAHLYYALGPRFEQALRYLADTDLAATAPERYDLDGDNLYAMVQEYESKKWPEGVWEAHRQYADLQCVVSGAEYMGYAQVRDLEPATTYDSDGDVQKLRGKGTFHAMKPKTFIVLFPQDAHMPGMAIEAPSQVKKAVVKVRL